MIIKQPKTRDKKNREQKKIFKKAGKTNIIHNYVPEEAIIHNYMPEEAMKPWVWKDENRSQREKFLVYMERKCLSWDP